MKVTILVDNNTLIDRYFTSEPAFSAYIEADGCRVLFDTGYSDCLIKNAQRLGVDLLNLDYIILSHGHIDHTGGLYHLIRLYTDTIIEDKHLKMPHVIAHPFCFYPRPKSLLPDIGPILSEEEVRRFMPVNLSTVPVQLSQNLFFLGEITRKFPFEEIEQGERFIKMPDGSIQDDHLIDDTSLAYRTPEGLVIITGCAHSGICNTIEHARCVCLEEKIIDCIGGFHLMKDGPKLDGTLNYLKGISLPALHACHCTSLYAKIALAGVAPLHETGVGLKIDYIDNLSV